MMSSADKNKLNLEMQELRDHIDIKDRKINVLQRKVSFERSKVLMFIQMLKPCFSTDWQSWRIA